MADTEWVKDLKPEELPEPYKRIAEMLGVEAAITLSKEYGGMGLYLPKFERSIRPARDELIRKQFTGYNYRELARKFGLTESWIREILSGTLEAQGLQQITVFK